MKPWAEAFYKSKAWQNCREGYAKKCGYLCESCVRQGLHVRGEIVHHKVPLTPENISDASVALNWDNLELVCRDCHAQRHAQHKKRYRINDNGDVVF